jgi:DNA-binding transcriptional regulator YhcF (GntR family)
MNLRTIVIGGLPAVFGVFLTLAIVASTVAQRTPGYSRDLLADPLLPSLRSPAKVAEVKPDEVKNAIALAEASESEYRKAIEANRRQPGAISESEVERLYRTYSDDMLSALRKDVKALHAEIEQLRKTVEDMSTVKVRPL